MLRIIVLLYVLGTLACLFIAAPVWASSLTVVPLGWLVGYVWQMRAAASEPERPWTSPSMRPVAPYAGYKPTAAHVHENVKGGSVWRHRCGCVARSWPRYDMRLNGPRHNSPGIGALTAEALAEFEAPDTDIPEELAQQMFELTMTRGRDFR